LHGATETEKGGYMASIKKHNNEWRAIVHRKNVYASRVCKTKGQAERWARTIETSIDDGEYEKQQQEKEIKDNDITLAEALDRYVEVVSPTMKGKAVVNDTSRARQIKKYDIAEMLMSEIKSHDVATFRDQRMKDVAPSTTKLALALISCTFETARKEWKGQGHLVNPVLLIKKPSLKGRERDRRLREGEYDALMKTSCEFNNTMRYIIPFAIETAMRQGEIAKIEDMHVDLDKRSTVLYNTKNTETRRVPMSTSAISIINNLLPCGGLVFGYEDSHSIGTEFAKICKRAGIKGLRFHDLRHEAVSRLFERGLSTEQVMVISGHKTYSQLKRYTHLMPSNILEKLG